MNPNTQVFWGTIPESKPGTPRRAELTRIAQECMSRARAAVTLASPFFGSLIASIGYACGLNSKRASFGFAMHSWPVQLPTSVTVTRFVPTEGELRTSSTQRPQFVLLP